MKVTLKKRDTESKGSLLKLLKVYLLSKVSTIIIYYILLYMMLVNKLVIEPN
jgi:hypothetical protein